MGNPTIASLNVKYSENGVEKNRVIKFKGNFGFSLDGVQYTVKNGQVYNSNNEVETELDLARGLAYQLIGMSCTNGSERDYTYTSEDISQAEKDKRSKRDDCENDLFMRAKTTIGYGAGNVTYADVVDNKYTTHYKHKDYNNITTGVSIWTMQ